MPQLIEAEPARCLVTVDSQDSEPGGVWAQPPEPEPTRPEASTMPFTPHSGSDQSISHHNVYVPGTRAAQAMITVAQTMANLSQTASRHGRTSARSIQIASRLKNRQLYAIWTSAGIHTSGRPCISFVFWAFAGRNRKPRFP